MLFSDDLTLIVLRTAKCILKTIYILKINV